MVSHTDILSSSDIFIDSLVISIHGRCISIRAGEEGEKGMLVLLVCGNTVGAWVLLVIAMVSWEGVGMEVVGMDGGSGVGMEVVGREHKGTARKDCLHNGRCQSTPCAPGGDTVDT